MSLRRDSELTEEELRALVKRRVHAPIIYQSQGRFVYDLGGVVCKESRPAYDPPEAKQCNFIRSRTDIPAPRVLGEYTLGRMQTAVSGYFMEKVEGETLASVWLGLSLIKRKRIADQIAEYLRVLRVVNATYIGGVEVDLPVRDEWLFYQHEPYGPFHSTDEFWEAITDSRELAVPVSPEALAALRRRMPECEPFTFTHGDLHTKNIIVQDDKVVGLIDWETAGYYPVWWEHAKFLHSVAVHPLWRRLVHARMQRHPDGYEFVRLLHILQGYDGKEEAAKLNEVLSREGA